MKISIDKITDYKIEIEKYYSDDIFSFKLATSGLFEQRFQLFREKYYNEESRIKEVIEKECKRNEYDQIGDIDCLMKIDMKHVYSADKYITNGQNLITLIEIEGEFELGIHKDLNTFSSYFYNSPLFGQFSLSNLRLKRYKILEKAESEIMRILSKIEITRIPIDHVSDSGFMEIRKVYPSTYFFTFNNLTIVLTEGWIDKITEEAIETFKPHQIRCCKNCKHFKFSGMSYDMSGGFTGYCLLVREKLEEPTVTESTTRIWNWCSKFEIK